MAMQDATRSYCAIAPPWLFHLRHQRTFCGAGRRLILCQATNLPWRKPPARNHRWARILTLSDKGVCYTHWVHRSFAWVRVKWVAMDITDFHEYMRDKYAEKHRLDRQLLSWIVGLLLAFSLVFWVVLGYAVR